MHKLLKSKMKEQIHTTKDGQKYSGTPIGYAHHWKYEDPDVQEQKISPEQWQFKMTCLKRKVQKTNTNGSIQPGTQYHWYFIGDQIVRKIDENTYQTDLNAIKYKLGHKRPYWKGFSYTYEDQIKANKSLNQMKINALNQELQMLKNIEKREPTQKEISQWAINKNK